MHYSIIKPESHQVEQLRTQFIHLFKSVFSSAPFWEAFTDEEVDSIYEEYLQPECLLIGAFNEQNTLIGYGASVPVTSASKELQQILSQYAEPNKIVYNADLAVYEEYRNQGIGSHLIARRHQWAQESGFQYVAMRTNKLGSMSKPLYTKLGFEQLAETMTVCQKRVRKDIPETESRILLMNSISALQIAA